MYAQQIEWMPYTVMTDGHRFYPLSYGHDNWFEHLAKPMVAIADDSGRLPQDTDDGILWLDFNRHLMAGGANNSGPPTIPLLTVGKIVMFTATDMPTMLMLAHKYQWSINAHGVLFNASRKIHTRER